MKSLTEITLKNYFDIALENLLKASNEIESNLMVAENRDEYNFSIEKLKRIEKAINIMLYSDIKKK